MWENPEYISEEEYRNRIQPKWIHFCRKKLDNFSWWNTPGPHVRFVKIQEYYREGRMNGYLHLMDFKQFQKKMTQNRYGWYSDYDWKKNFTRNHYKYNRNNGKKFQKAFHKKKELSEHEIAKREWRKFKKDRRSQKFHKNYRGVKQQFKHDCARFHRNFEKQCIQREDYDKLHHRTWKQCIDWWSYD